MCLELSKKHIERFVSESFVGAASDGPKLKLKVRETTFTYA